MSAEPVLIVGGGVSGLATAYFLSKRSVASILVEKNNRLGGLIQTDEALGCRLEAGPDSYIAAKPAVTQLAAEIPALQGQIIESNDAARRIFIFRGGSLVPFPRGMVMMVPSLWPPLLRSNLLGLPSKLRFLSETRSAPRQRIDDISVGQLVQEHFGSEVLEAITEPLLCGIYGGDAALLSASSVLPRFLAYERKYGSLIRGVRQERRQSAAPTGSLFLSLRDGMQSLTDALAAAAPLARVLYTTATKVERCPDGWRLWTEANSLVSSKLVLAGPAYMGAELLTDAAPSLAGELSAIPYSSALVVNSVYERSGVGCPLNGFGFLVPRAERNTLSAATWVSTKFPSRIPPNLAGLRGFVVGDQAQQLMRTPDSDVIELVCADYRRIMGIQARPLLSTVHRWPRSMPQYLVGHPQRKESIARALSDCPGLFLVGNAYDGVGIPDCVRLGEEMANHIAARVP
jgi:oxygen-dependent protoporphyrinogen oxidase